MYRLIVTLSISCLFCWSLHAQSYSGRLVEESGEPIFAANVYCSSDVTQGTITDLNGAFTFDLSICDSLCFSFLGFDKKCLSMAEVKAANPIVLATSENTFKTIEVTATDPISNKFSVVKLEKMDIYQNPVAAGDPLKAITILPSSTNADESANPVLRGSSPDRSRVTVNGVPIRSPVRNGQLNGIGNFSLFNAEIISKLYVYASNPPLTYGNTTAGLVEVETVKELDYSQLQLSASLAGVGAFLSQKVGPNFFQAYSNVQYSDGFIGLNKNNVPNLQKFGSEDAGLNFRIRTGDKSYWNSFNYFINEAYESRASYFGYEGATNVGKRRFFSINNWVYKFENSLIKFNSLFDTSKQYFSFGNLSSDLDNNQLFFSGDYKLFINPAMTLQTGASVGNARYELDNIFSEYSFSLDPATPTWMQDTLLQGTNLEAYAFYNWDMSEELSVSGGLRKNIPFENQIDYLSYQLSFRYQPDDRSRFLLSGGRYYNYSTPSFSNQNLSVLDSYQAALDYDYQYKDFKLLAAIYYKLESGQFVDAEFLTFNEIESFGLEIFLSKNISKSFKVSLSNTFIDQQVSNGSTSYRSANDFDYFFKASLQYANPKIVTAALTYIGRPGRYYTPIVDRVFNVDAQLFAPVYGSPSNGAQYGSYNNLSFSCSRYFPIGNKAIIGYFSAANLLNTRNEQNALYDIDFREQFFDYYQFRVFYFGAVFQFNY